VYGLEWEKEEEGVYGRGGAEEVTDSSEVTVEGDVRPGEGSSSSSSGRALLNIQFVTVLLLPMPSWRATSRTDARRAFDSRLVSGCPVFAFGAGLWFRACTSAGRGMGARWRGNAKLGFMVSSKKNGERTGLE
jgi:hypothetical protein